jgi:hypothetical protein
MKSKPILLALLQDLVTCLIIGFTPPRSITRLGAFMIAALCTLQCISTSIDHMVHTPWASLVGGYAVSHLFHYIDLVLLNQWSFKTHGPGSDYDFLDPKSQSNGNNLLTVIPHKNDNSFWAKFRFGIWATCTTRFIGTREQVKNIPLFVRRDPGFVPSRSRFLKHTASFILLCYLGLDVMDNFTDLEIGQRYFIEENISFFRRLGEITAEEISMRVSAAIGAAIGLVLVQGGCYNVFAFLSVLLGFTEPCEWPPFYGPLSETYTLRKLWG